MIERVLIAKTGNISTEQLPLYVHLRDTAGIMKKLTEEFLSESFCKSCDLCREEFEKVTTFLAYAHDIGKATIGFQYKIGQHLLDRVKVLEHEKLQLNAAAQMVLCGLIIAADWIAINIEYFPLIDIENEGENIRYNKRIESAWEIN